MICSYCNPSMIKGGLPESSFMTPSFLQEFRTVKGKGTGNNPVLQLVFLCASLPPPHFSLLEGRGTCPSRALLFPSPAEPLSSPPPAADGAQAPAANLARRCQPQHWQTTGRRGSPDWPD